MQTGCVGPGVLRGIDKSVLDGKDIANEGQ